MLDQVLLRKLPLKNAAFVAKLGRAWLFLLRLMCFFYVSSNASTHIGGNTLDLVFTSCPNCVRYVSVRADLALSDHYALECEFESCVSFISTVQMVPNFAKGDYQSFSEFLNRKKWLEVFEKKSVQDAWNYFKGAIQVGMESFVPWRKRRSKDEPVWMQSALRSAIRKKSTLWKKHKQTKEPHDLAVYKLQKSLVQKMVRRAKLDFENRLSLNQNIRSLHAYVRNKRRDTKKITSIIDSNGKICESNQEIVRVINDYFASVFNPKGDPCSVNSNGGKGVGLGCVFFYASVVFNKLKALKPSTAPGPDDIPAFVLNKMANSLAAPLAALFNMTMLSGEIPNDWTKADVFPLHKGGDMRRAENFRPVSLTSICCKVMEGIVKDNMTRFLGRKKFITEEQHGFRQGFSCTTSHLLFHDYITRHLDHATQVDVIFLDFAKAFDKVDHNLLIQKLISAGVGGSLLQWIKCWMSGRLQRVVLNGEKSDWRSVTSGVPQGSVLGPLLFLIFINDLQTRHGSTMMKFADDVKLFRSVTNPSDCLDLQRDLELMCQWAASNRMALNVTKCLVWNSGQSSLNPLYNYVMNGTTLKRTSTHRDLGVSFDSRLNFSGHCANIVSKANQVLGMIGRHFLTRNRETFVGLFKMYVRPLLEFSSQVWSPPNRANVLRVERVQRRATKMVHGLGSTDYETRLQLLQLPSLETRRRHLDMVLVYRVFSGLIQIRPLGLSSPFFLREGSSHDRPKTRMASTEPVKEYLTKTRVRYHSFFVRMSRSWNKLPLAIRQAKTTHSFRRELLRLDVA